MAFNDTFQVCTDITEFSGGGQKVVYSAVHPNHGNVVLKKGNYPHPRALERISREVALLADLDSPYYPRHFGYQVDAQAKEFLIVEERIDGEDLSNCLERFQSEGDIIGLLRNLVEGLDLLWSRRVVHRDIKPANIIIKEDGSPVIIDLGIARLLDETSLTHTAAPIGPCTRIYASPEQLLNKKLIIDIRTDFFTLGILGLQLFLGFHPFDPARVGEGDSIPDNILNNRFVDPSSKQGTSEPFVSLIQRLLASEPHQRFRNSRALAEYLSNYEINNS